MWYCCEGGPWFSETVLMKNLCFVSFPHGTPFYWGLNFQIKPACDDNKMIELFNYKNKSLNML